MSGLIATSQRKFGLVVVIALLAGASCAGADRSSHGRDETSSQQSEAARRLVVQTVDIGHSGGIDVEVGDDAVWVSTRDGVRRVDPATNMVTGEIPLEGAFDLDLGGDSLWATNTYEGTLSHIDLATERVSETNEVADPVVIGLGMLGIGAGERSSWVSAGDALNQIDPATGVLVRRIPIPDIGSSWGGDPGIDAGGGTVWMAGTYALNRIDLS